MPIINPWLTPFQRSYNSIKATLIEKLKLKVPEVSDFSEGNIFIIIISIFAAIAEVLHYYIDNMARETFFITARKYSSLVAHSKLFDYHIKGANPATVDILLKLSTGLPLSGTVTIPIGTTFISKSSVQFISTKTINWTNTYGVKVPLIQWSSVTGASFGTITAEDVYLTLGFLGEGLQYAEGTMSLAITFNSVTENWELVDTFAYSKSDSKHFKVEIGNDQEPYIIFGDGQFGMKPQIGSTVVGNFYVTRGQSGNVPAGDITTVPSSVSSQATNIVCNNTMNASGGTNYEDFDMLKTHVPLSIKTLGAAITPEDYKDITMTIAGVDKAYIENECGRFIHIYITPDGGGIASQGLIDLVRARLLKHKVLGTSFYIYPTSESLIILEATITGKKSFKAIDIQNQVTGSMMSAFDYNNSDISKPVRLSDIYATIDGQSMVDFLIITNLYLKPLAINVGATTQELNYDITISNIITTSVYYVRYSSSDSKFTLLYSNGSNSNYTLEANNTWVTINEGVNIWALKILAPSSGIYSNGDMWRITVQPNRTDQIPVEHSIPVFKNASQAILTINETV